MDSLSECQIIGRGIAKCYGRCLPWDLKVRASTDIMGHGTLRPCVGKLI